MIACNHRAFIDLLSSKNNRLVWGAMHGIHAVTFHNHKVVFASLSKVMEAVDKGSVVTRDHGVGILICLCGFKPYYASAFPLLIEQLTSCPTNQLPAYAEKSADVIHEKDHAAFKQILSKRLKEVEQEPKRKRIEKVLKKLA